MGAVAEDPSAEYRLPILGVDELGIRNRNEEECVSDDATEAIKEPRQDQRHILGPQSLASAVDRQHLDRSADGEGAGTTFHEAEHLVPRGRWLDNGARSQLQHVDVPAAKDQPSAGPALLLRQRGQDRKLGLDIEETMSKA